MTEQAYKYVIVGGGLAGASAIEGIREHDREGSVLLIGQERRLPYDRPPLSKGLWLGKKKIEQITLHDEAFYAQNDATLRLGRTVTSLDVSGKAVTDDEGERFRYEKLLLATGGTPRKLSIPGGDLEGILYYRTMDDYLRLREVAAAGRKAVVIGGGFIGSEIAAALCANKVDVTMLFPDASLVSRIFPEALGQAITRHFEERGVLVLAGELPASITGEGRGFVVATKGGKQLAADAVIAGIGIAPEIELAARAGLVTGNGIEVDEYLATSDPDVFAAGDNACFPYQALGTRTRIEHWDNSLSQGKHAGRNMAGAREAFTHMPYFFSDLFEFGYEAVGEVDARLETAARWAKEFDTGVVAYLKEGRVRGLMMCNLWDKVEAARMLIRKGVGADEALQSIG